MTASSVVSGGEGQSNGSTAKASCPEAEAISVQRRAALLVLLDARPQPLSPTAAASPGAAATGFSAVYGLSIGFKFLPSAGKSKQAIH
jgi:hypothetical protein